MTPGYCAPVPVAATSEVSPGSQALPWPRVSITKWA